MFSAPLIALWPLPCLKISLTCSQTAVPSAQAGVAWTGRFAGVGQGFGQGGVIGPPGMEMGDG